MSRKRYSPEELVRKLRETDALLGRGETVGSVIRQLSVNKVSGYR